MTKDPLRDRGNVLKRASLQTILCQFFLKKMYMGLPVSFTLSSSAALTSQTGCLFTVHASVLPAVFGAGGRAVTVWPRDGAARRRRPPLSLAL
jgi:hypothetical protein